MHFTVLSFACIDLLYTQGEAIYSPGSSTADEKRNCVVRGLECICLWRSIAYDLQLETSVL